MSKKTIKEYQELKNFLKEFKSLLKTDCYLSRSAIKKIINRYEDTLNFFNVLNKALTLDTYCQLNHCEKQIVDEALNIYKNQIEIIDERNNEYIKKKAKKEKKYLDNILKEVDKNIVLDDKQREVVLSDEDYTLVVAGAGAGKTTTVAAKAKYLVEKKKIKPNEILIVSFTNKAVGELREKINDDLKLDCLISTFHSIGNAILKTKSNEKLNIVQENKIYFVLDDYFKNKVLKDEKLTKKLVLFFASYFNVPDDQKEADVYLNELAKGNYSTLRSDLGDFKQEIIDNRLKKKQTILNEQVRSYAEVEIANYLYLNNLDYEYEPIYRYNIKYAKKPYTPDFLIKQGDKEVYLEHFGISQKGENPLYSQEQLASYKKAINDKVRLHKEHNTELIYTFARYNDGKDLIYHLNQELKKAGFVLKPRNEKEVLKKIIASEETRYINRLLILLCRFIELFKTNGYNETTFEKFKKQTNNVRNHLFLDIAKECYLVYQNYLKENNAIDFSDMINNSALVLEDMIDKKQRLHFKYIIVDEYQDISKQRFDLVGMLHKVCDAKVVAVGDDWQSIYAFSGSDIQLFLDFEKKMGYAKLLKIENTYRNAQEIIDIAGGFIQKNERQIKKCLQSAKHINNPITIYTYDSTLKQANSDNKSGANYEFGLAVQKCLEDIAIYNKKEKKKDLKILLLGRYNYDANRLELSGLFQVVNKKDGKVKCLKYPKFDLYFLTVHASKGLGYDNVIILNGVNGTFGFPSKIQNDPVMAFVLKNDVSYEYAEERRLFYVAMTRTKNRVFCVAPESYPSQFLLEIKKDYENIVLKGQWNENLKQKSYKHSCPLCGYPLQYKYKPAYGLRLNICMNEPELCGFMTNDLKGGKLQIMKCEECDDGYLVVKKAKDEYFLGCTNYQSDGKGCNNSLSLTKYYQLHNFMMETPEENKIVRKKKTELTFKEDKLVSYQNSYDFQKKEDLAKASIVVLSCIARLSSKIYLNGKRISELLCGVVPKEKYYQTLMKIPEFGAFKKQESSEVEYLVMALVRSKHLLRTKEAHPVLHPTKEGENFLKVQDKKDVNRIARCYKQVEKLAKENAPKESAIIDKDAI